MKKIVAATLAGMLVLAMTSGAQAAPRARQIELPPEVVSAISDAGPDGQVAVVVTFKDRPNLSPEKAEKKAARRQRLIKKLQATSLSSQSGAKSVLNKRKAEGKVDDVQSFWIVNAISVTATPEVINELAARKDVASITLDAIDVVPAYGNPETGVATVNAPALWDLGYSGQGVVVASLDSGVDNSHPDLANRWRGGSNSWFDPYGQHTTPTDMTGHGTGTMGLIVGGDAGGTSIGVAPGAEWIAAKIFDDSGQATASAIHAAFEWVLDPDGDPNTDDGADVVNNSWSYGSGPGCDLSFQPDLQALRAAGVIPVFAAGNYGSGANSSPSPANNPEALAVGAVTRTNNVWSSSSRGPSACGEPSTVYPELVAPGVGVHTAQRYGLYQNASGTSMAAPHVTGALALLLSAFPDLTDTEQVDALEHGAVDLGDPGPDSNFGYGLVDVDGAYQWLSTPPPPPPPAFFTDGFESGDTSAWSNVVDNGGRLSVSSAAALDGGQGLAALITNRKAMYVADDSPAAAVAYSASFRFDPNSVSLPNNANQDLLLALDGAGNLAIRLQLRSSSGTYQLRILARDDGGANRATAWVPISDAAQVVALDWNAATTPGGNDGQVAITIDGNASAVKTRIKNSTVTLEQIQLGAPKAMPKGSSGTEYFDDYVTAAMS